MLTTSELVQTRCMFHKCPPVLIPDTILLNNKSPTTWSDALPKGLDCFALCMHLSIRNGSISTWLTLRSVIFVRRYFTSLKTGALQRRSKELTAQKITDALLRKKDMSTDISCVYVGCAKGDSQVSSSVLIA